MNKENAITLYSFSRNLGMSSSNIFLPFFLIEKNMIGLTGVFFSSIALITFLFGPLSGLLSDRYGRKCLMLAGALIYGIAALFFAAAIFYDSFVVFIGGTSLMNFSFILSEPSVSAGLAEAIPEEKRGSGIGRFQTIAESTLVAGPLIGGMAISTSLNMFVLFFIITFLVSIIALINIDEKQERNQPTYTIKNMISFLISKKNIFTYSALTSLAASLFPVVLFIALFGKHLTPFIGGALISLFLAINLVLNIPSGVLSDRYGCVPVLMTAAVLGIIAPIPLVLSTKLPFFVISLILFGACMGFFEVAFQTFIAKKIDSSRLAFTYSSMSMVGDLVRIPIPLVVIVLFQNNQVLVWSILVCVCWVIPSMLLNRWDNDSVSSPPHE
ncbi:MAG: MFS transporter [Theionarchaea archaeon]|nr:MFS transporter [Theionarchaea archaeon]